MKRFFILAAIAVSSCSFGQAPGIDHIDPVDSDLVSTPANGRVQVFEDTPDQSRMVIEDFLSDQGIVDSASMAFEVLGNNPVGHPDAWRISFWASAADAANSGNDFTGNTVATTLVNFSDTNWAISPLFGAGSNTQALRIDFTNLGLNIGTGVRYMGIAPVQPSSVTPNWYILAHNAPSLLGNGTANDSIGINPSGALGLGTSYSVGTNAAYALVLVPEPASIASLVLALGAFAAMRRRRS